jgi:hypothetical protein
MRDPLWVVGTLLIVIGFGPIVAVGFINPFARIFQEDRTCHIGLRRYTTIPLLTFDIFINVSLTLCFVYLLSPVIRSNNIPMISPSIGRFASWLCSRWQRERDTDVTVHTGNPRVAKSISRLLLRTFLGSCLVLISTIVNTVQLTILGEGREWGMVCFMICTADSTFVNPDQGVKLILPVT